MLLPIESLKYVNSLTHEGKVVVFATTEATATDPTTGDSFTYGLIYYTVRQDGFEDNTDRTAIVGWKHWTLLPFIDEKPDSSVAKREAEDNFLIKSHYRRTASIGTVGQVQAVSHKEQIYLFRTDRRSGHILVDRFILNGLTNELLPKLEIRYKRSRKKYEANEKMKIVNGRLTGVDSLDFRDANDRSFTEPSKELRFLPNLKQSQFAVTVVPTTDKDTDRWHFFLADDSEHGGGQIKAVSVRSNQQGEFVLDDQLVVEPAADENARPLVRSVPALIQREFELSAPLGKGLASTKFNIQIEEATKGGPQLMKGATKILLAFNTATEQLGTLSFGLSTDGLLSLIDPQVDALEEMRPAKRREIFLPINHLEEIQALGPALPLAGGDIQHLSRGENDQVIVETTEAHGRGLYDKVSIEGGDNFNGTYTVTKVGEHQFKLSQNWAAPALGAWEEVLADPEKGLVFDGLITSIKQVGDDIIFTTGLEHGLENDLEVLIKNHLAIEGEFEVKPIDSHSFLINTDWDPVQVINLFLEAARRKGLVFDGDRDAVGVEEVLLDLPRQEKAFAHTFSCWLKPAKGGNPDYQLLIGEANGAVQLYLKDEKAHFRVELPEGYYELVDPDPVDNDHWVNFAAVVERQQAFGPLKLRLYRNAEWVPATTTYTPNPNLAFPQIKDQGLYFDGLSAFAQFVFTHQYPPPGRDFTIEFLIKPEDLRSHQPVWMTELPINRGWDSQGRPQVINAFSAITLRQGGQLKAHFTLMDESGNPFLAEVTSDIDLQSGEWSQVALVGKFQGARGSLQWVINGKAEAPQQLEQGYLFWKSGLNRFGKSEQSGHLFRDKDRFFKGTLGQFRIWGNARSLNQINQEAKLPLAKETKGLLFDLINWPKYSGDLNTEGAGWPAPGEVLFFHGAELASSPVIDYGLTGESRPKAFNSYQLPAWNGDFHFGGIAPAKALRLSGNTSFQLLDKPWPLDLGAATFTFECWFKTSTGGVLWSLRQVDADAEARGQFLPQIIRLADGQLELSFSSRGGLHALSLPGLFDNEWHFLSIAVDRPDPQSNDGFAQICLDGSLQPGSLRAGRDPDPAQVAFRIGASIADDNPEDHQLTLAHCRFWSYLRTPEQLAAAPAYRPSGREAGLVAYWPLDKENLFDHSRNQMVLGGDAIPELVDCPSLTFSPGNRSFSGTLAEVRIWNSALEEAYLKSTLFIPLAGKEYRLAGNWRMGAIWEEDRRVTDFSSFGNDGQLFGEVYLSPDSVRRRLGSTDATPLATTYRNDELVAVSQRAVYEESFEFRLIDDNNKPLTAPTKAAAAFKFMLRGKASRSQKDWIGHEVFAPQIVSEMIGEPLNSGARSGDKDYGWFRASCRFVVPDDVALLRVFGLAEVNGDWERMEIRKHRLTHISDAISKVVIRDDLQTLATVGELPFDGRKVKAEIDRYQSQIRSYKARIRDLDKWIKSAEEEGQTLEDLFMAASNNVIDASFSLIKATTSLNELHQKQDIVLSYSWRIKAKHSGLYLSFVKNRRELFTGIGSSHSQARQYSYSIDNEEVISYYFQIELADDTNELRIKLAGTNHYLGTVTFPDLGTGSTTGAGIFLGVGTAIANVQYEVLTLGLENSHNLFLTNGLEKIPYTHDEGFFDIKFDSCTTNRFLPRAGQNNLLSAHFNTYEQADAIRNTPFRIEVPATGLTLGVPSNSQGQGVHFKPEQYNPAKDSQLFYFEIQADSSNHPDLVDVKQRINNQKNLIEQANNRLKDLKRELEEKRSPQDWKDERLVLQGKVNDAYNDINNLKSEYQESVLALNTQAQALPQLPTNDPQELSTKGAYLGFVQATEQLSLFENCEGLVQLTYGDRYGRLRQTSYDVTADSRNPTFEEWIPDGPRLALELTGDSHLVPDWTVSNEKPFQLGASYTIEWWMNCPVNFAEPEAETEADAENEAETENEPYNWQFKLLETAEGIAIPVLSNSTTNPTAAENENEPEAENEPAAETENEPAAENISLAILRPDPNPAPDSPDKFLADTLVEVDDLSKGWHHFCLVKSGMGINTEILLYVDGELVGSYQDYVAREVNKKPEEEQAARRKELLANRAIFDDFGFSDIVKIGAQDASKQVGVQLAELRIWQVDLNAEEVMANSKLELTGQEPGLLAYYKLNEGQGDLIRNYAQTSAVGNLKAVGDASWSAFPNVIGGSNRKVTFLPLSRPPEDEWKPRIHMSTKVADHPKAFDIQCISFWVKLDHRLGASHIISINQKVNNQISPDFSLIVGYDDKDNKDDKLRLSSSSGSFPLNPTKPFPYGSWTHFCLNMEHGGQVLAVYQDGEAIGQTHILLPQYGPQDEGQFEFGWFSGEMADFIIYKEPLDPDTIRQQFNFPIDSNDDRILAYFPFDNPGESSHRIENLADPDRPLIFEDGLSYQIRRANDLPIALNNVISNEYSTIAIDPQTGAKKAMMRRFFCLPTSAGVHLYANKRIEELELLWVGNAQFKPTLLGYIEGAPPIPSENLTVPDNLGGYNGATSVSLETSEETAYNWTREEDNSAGFDLDLFLGGGGDIAINIPFVGRVKLGEFKAGFKGGLSSAYHFLNSSSITASSTNITTDELSLSGSPEEKAKFPHLGRRFVPKNVGYALVVSGLADVFVLRLRRSKKMVAYQVKPNNDLPMDINTITFLINPAYTMNGSLDGMTGTQATSQRYFRQVPEMRAQYGSLYPASYFRLHEAYDLKRQIENEDKRRAAYFDNFNSRLVSESSLDRNIDNSEFDAAPVGVNQDISGPGTDDEGQPLSQQDQMAAATGDKDDLASEAEKQGDAVEKEAEERQKEIDAAIENQDQKANASYQLARWQKKMEDLQIRASKRNIVNTYVWDADGGLRTESQQFSNTVEHTIGGSVEMNANLGGLLEANILGFSGELTALATVSLTQQLTKTSTNSKGFALNVDLSGVESTGITDHDDNPIMPGEKVDRYRFMSFYLEGSTKHFHDFFNDVVDPEWLQSNDEEARALRQTQAGKANASWRILHRVTYVERPALKGFGKDTRPQRQLSQETVDPLDEIREQMRAIMKFLHDKQE